MNDIKFKAYLKLTNETVDVQKIDIENKQISFYKNNDDGYLYVCDFKNIEFIFVQQDIKQQLDESFTEEDVEGLIEDRDKTIKFLQKQLAEKEKMRLLDEKEFQHYCAYKQIETEIKGCLDREREYKKQLAEKDIRIEELEGQFAYECECNKQLVEVQKQLEKKQNEIDEINKEFVQAVHDWKALCAKKDEEIEKLKQQYTILENENGKLTTELIMGKYKKAQKEVSFGKQLAIQELEKVKNFICDYSEITGQAWNHTLRFLNNKIKELKGEKDE